METGGRATPAKLAPARLRPTHRPSPTTVRRARGRSVIPSGNLANHEQVDRSRRPQPRMRSLGHTHSTAPAQPLGIGPPSERSAANPQPTSRPADPPAQRGRATVSRAFDTRPASQIRDVQQSKSDPAAKHARSTRSRFREVDTHTITNTANPERDTRPPALPKKTQHQYESQSARVGPSGDQPLPPGKPDAKPQSSFLPCR
jgi:hypothetical protein